MLEQLSCLADCFVSDEFKIFDTVGLSFQFFSCTQPHLPDCWIASAFCITLTIVFDLSSKMGRNAVLISSKILYDRQKLTRGTRAIARFDLFRGGTFVGAAYFFP